jgi:hypothetical protein
MSRKKPGKRTLLAYLCRFRPEPEGGFTLTCPKLPPLGWPAHSAPDRDLASPIDQLVPVAAATPWERCRRCPAAWSSRRWSGPASRCPLPNPPPLAGEGTVSDRIISFATAMIQPANSRAGTSERSTARHTSCDTAASAPQPRPVPRLSLTGRRERVRQARRAAPSPL